MYCRNTCIHRHSLALPADPCKKEFWFSRLVHDLDTRKWWHQVGKELENRDTTATYALPHWYIQPNVRHIYMFSGVEMALGYRIQ